jgi:hypothetical protein
MAGQSTSVSSYKNYRALTDLFPPERPFYFSLPRHLSSKAYAYSTCHPADPAWKHERRSPSKPMEDPTRTSDLMPKNGRAEVPAADCVDAVGWMAKFRWRLEK